MADSQVRDADELPENDRPVLAPRCRLRSLRVTGGARPFVVPGGPEELTRLVSLAGHSISKSGVGGPDGFPLVGGGLVLFCTACGECSWGGLRALGELCPHRPPTKDRRQQLSRASR
eukprot:6663893-Pyramimonas_sp.AAC.1